MNTVRSEIKILAACIIYCLIAIVCPITANEVFAEEQLHIDNEDVENLHRLKAVEWNPEQDPSWQRMSEQLAHWFAYNKPFFTLPDNDAPLQVWRMKDLVDGPDLQLSILINSIGLDESVLDNAKILVWAIDNMVGPAALSNDITADNLPNIYWGQFSEFSIYQLRHVPDDKPLQITLKQYDLNDSYDLLSGDSPLHLLALRARIYLFDFNMKQFSRIEVVLPVHY